MTCADRPEHRACSWKAIAEAHLRERVSNPHDYRALSIELEGMRLAGLNWEREFTGISSLVAYLETLFDTKLRRSTLWHRLEDIPERYFYQIQESTENWQQLLSKSVANCRQ